MVVEEEVWEAEEIARGRYLYELFYMIYLFCGIFFKPSTPVTVVLRCTTERDDSGPTQPALMSFRQYILERSDDSISDEEALKRYNEYKTNFRRDQILNFFNEHKEEDWYVCLLMYPPRLFICR